MAETAVTPLQEYLTRREDVLEQVKQLLIQNLHLPLESEEIDPDVVLFGSGLALDSVDAVEIVVSLESAFDIQFPDQNATALAPGAASSGDESGGIVQHQAAAATQAEAQTALRLSLRTVNTLVDTVLWLQDYTKGEI